MKIVPATDIMVVARDEGLVGLSENVIYKVIIYYTYFPGNLLDKCSWKTYFRARSMSLSLSQSLVVGFQLAGSGK